MREKSTISIIIPTYNTQEYIQQGVSSLINQEFENIQIIPVDDGSQDKSAEICDAIALKNDRVICIHQKNKGILQTRLNGVRATGGEYIGFIDSDDIIEPDMYVRLYNNVINYEADISHSGYKMILGEKEKSYYGTGKIKIQDRITGIKDLLEGFFIEPTACTKLYKRALFDSIDVPFRVDNHEDLLLNFMLFNKCQKAIYEDFTPYHYIRRDTSYCKTAEKSSLELDSENVLSYIKELSKNDSEVSVLVDGKIASSWIQKYNSSIYESRERRRQIRKAIPKRVKTYIFKAKLQMFLIRYLPVLYNIIYRIIR